VDRRPFAMPPRRTGLHGDTLSPADALTVLEKGSKPQNLALIGSEAAYREFDPFPAPRISNVTQ
jgi:hypothetical protein